MRRGKKTTGAINLEIVFLFLSLLCFFVKGSVSPGLHVANLLVALPMSYRERLVAFYKEHNPAKLNEVDSLLSVFAGREESMFAALQAKYLRKGSPEETLCLSKKETAAGVTNANDVHAEVQELVRAMESVDLGKLLARLEGQAVVESEPIIHALRFAQHLVLCARRLAELAQNVGTTTEPTAKPREMISRKEVGSQREKVIESHNVAIQTMMTGTVCAETQTDVDDKQVASLTFCGHVRHSSKAELESPTPQSDEVLLRHSTIRRVHNLRPDKHKKAAVVGTVLENAGPCDTNTITLEPGVYHENLLFANGGNVELVAAVLGEPVILKPLNKLEPVIRAEGPKTLMRVSGVVFADGDTTGNANVALSVPSNPLVAVADAARIEFYGCHFYRGSCAVEAVGPQTEVSLHLCVLSSCKFAGVFLHRGAKAAMKQCNVKHCEAGVRVASHSSIHLCEAVVEENLTDGIVSYEGATGVLERSSVLRNGGNGLFLSSGSSFAVVESTVELNSLYGIQRFQGSGLQLRGSVVRDNAMLPINDVSNATVA